MSGRRERIDALLERVGPELEALHDEAMEEIAQAEVEACKKEARYWEAREELGRVEEQILAATAEREELPIKATRAGMDEDYELEDELKGRYKNLRLALEALEDRRGSLKREIADLLPQPKGHDLDARIQAAASVAGAASRARADLEYLKEELTKALASAVDPVIQEHTTRLAETEQLGRDRAWALSPVGRRGLR